MGNDQVEIAIVGGGLVGTSLAIALGKRGLRATLLERSREVPDLLRGELIMPSGVAVLESLGLGDSLGEMALETKGVVLHHPAFEGGRCSVDYSMAPAPVSVDCKDWRPRGLCGWRRPLYEQLQKAAERTPTVDLRRGFELTQLRRAKDRSWILEARDGEKLRAKMVIAADGLHSRCRRQLNFEPYEKKQETFVQGFVGRSRTSLGQHVHVGVHELGAVFVFPFPDQHFRCTFEYHKDYRGELDSKDALGQHLRFLREALPEIWEQLGGAIEARTAVQTQPGYTMSLASVVEDGFALVGDAAGCLDPFTGFGMSLGLSDVQWLTETLLEADGDYSAGRLRGYELRRSLGLRVRRDATDALSYLFLNKSEGFADVFAARLGQRWSDREWVLPMVATQFAGYDPVLEPSFGMKNHFLGLL